MKRIYFHTFYALFIVAACAPSCVKKKLYHAEQLAYQNASGQVTALSKELASRRTEANALIKGVAELNQEVGTLKKQVADLQAELATRTATLGASSDRLATEKMALEKQLAVTAATLSNKEAELASLGLRENTRNQLIANEIEKLTMALSALNGNGYTIQQQSDHVQVTVQDAILFDRDGVKLNSAASGFLYGFAQYLAERPAHKVQIHAHVDNTLPPRQREILDGWSFSQVRALQIVRTLVGNYNVNAYMLAPVARGEYLPVSTNGTPEGRTENRRTVFLIYPG